MGTRIGKRNIQHLTSEQRRENQKRYKEVTMKSLHKEYVVECKCPKCCRRHNVIMNQKPFITPRVYCVLCQGARYQDDPVQYVIKIY